MVGVLRAWFSRSHTPINRCGKGNALVYQCDTLQLIRDTGIVAVIRGASASSVVEIAEALAAGGVRAIEVAMSNSRALSMIQESREAMPDDVLIGAGTVLDAETARAAIFAGASFILSPSLSRDVIGTCNRYSVAVIPGVLTPTEAVTAAEMGVRLVKVFPADSLGPSYIRALRGPLPHIEYMPVGGISLSNAGDFIKAGASALGVGGSLVSRSAVDSGDFRQITETAARFMEEVRQARNRAGELG